MRNFFLALLLSLSLATFPTFSVLGAPSPSHLRPKLQWFDAQGQIIEVNWKTSTRWGWEGTSPYLEVWVQLPSQIHVRDSGDPQVQIMDAPELVSTPTSDSDDNYDAEEGSNGQILILRTRAASTTVRLEVESKKGLPATPDKVGLLVSIDPSAAPQLLSHESCSQNGLFLRQLSGNLPGLLFVSIHCSKTKTGTAVDFDVPEGISVLGHNGAPLHGKKLRLHSPASPNTRELVRMSRKGQPGFTDFEVVQSDENPAPSRASSVAPASSTTQTSSTTTATGTQSPAHSSSIFHHTRVAAEAAPGFTGYGDSRSTPGTYGLNVGLRVSQDRNWPQHPSLTWEGALRAPLISLSDPGRFPATGDYSLMIGAVPPPLTRNGSTAYFLIPEVASHLVHLDYRDDASGFYAGPQATFLIQNGSSSFLAGRAYEARLGIAPLAGGGEGKSPFFHSYSADGSIAIEASRFSGYRLDLLTRLEYLNLLGTDNGGRVSVTQMSMGLLLWF